MQIQPTTTTPPSSSSSANALSASGLGNETTFLQLLVAQIQNQDPTQPMDSSTFLTQLASFSQLEQLIGIRQDTDALSGTASTSGTSTTGTTKTTSGN